MRGSGEEAAGHGAGDVVDVVTFDVERGKIREFARATFAEDPVHTRQDAMADAGWGGVLATPTHVVVSGHLRDQRGWVHQLGLELHRVVMGSVSWHYRRPVRAGDSLVGTRRVVADESKSGSRGPLRVVTLETEYRDGDGAVVVTQRDVVIERPRA